MGTVGKSYKRVDAKIKVSGEAKYVDDLIPENALVAKVLHSTIANGIVKKVDISEALKVDGVVKVVTCFDAPELDFPTPGHPWSVEASHQDVKDRRLLNKRVRCYGDDVAAVVAQTALQAERAINKIKVEYEEFEPILDPEKSMESTAEPLHEGRKKNILVHSDYKIGDYDKLKNEEKDLICVNGCYQTQIVQHCHIEPPISYAYMENDRVIVVSSTQIPHILRRIVGQALGIPWGKVRIIKPYVGGGFGNKQDALYEPLNAWLTTLVGGLPVKLELSREETFSSTRTRHAIKYYVETLMKPDGTLVGRKTKAISNQGAYASHGHSIVAKSFNKFRQTYPYFKVAQGDAYTVYTNVATAGAMRGYGVPEAAFAQESHMDDIAYKLGIDPCELRLKNVIKKGFKDPLNGLVNQSNGIEECIKKGKEHIKWDEKFNKYKNITTGDIRKGVGMAIFVYETGVYPIALETASCRLTLNQDGSVQMQLGATEIGQGADTVFSQMAAEILDLELDDVHIISQQDTDISPYDLGAYASRQTYVTGFAVRKTAEELKGKILSYASKMLKTDSQNLDLKGGKITDKKSGKELLSLSDMSQEAYYSLTDSRHLTAECTNHCTSNALAMGACFAEVEVDIPLGKINVLDIINLHDSGTIINPQLAQAQVHGGMSMGLGYALSERMIYSDAGKLLNGNLLDYKLPTSMDTPELNVHFVETKDPDSPFGNKALGEPPTVAQAGAIRNAVLNATGVHINSLPLHPQKLVEEFMKAGLIEKVGEN